MKIRTNLLGRPAMIVLTLALLPAAVQAQTARQAGAAPEDGVQDIVVTARRTSEKLQTTPLAVTALTSDALARRQIVDVTAIQQAAPSLSMAQSHSGVAITLRGQVQSNSDGSVDQSVGLYVDGVYIARQIAGGFDLIDINQVEVLRGPQGTLFGRNTTGGAVSITTNKPTDRLEGLVKAGIGNYDSRELMGLINVPIADAAAARIVYRHAQNDGFGRNINLGRRVGDDNTDYVRGSLRIAPTDGWSLTVVGDYFDRDNNGPLEHLLAYNPALLGNQDAVVRSPFYTTSSDLRSYARLKSWGTSATLEVPLGVATFKAITGYRGYKLDTLDDFDTTPIPFFTNNTIGRIKQFSQEAQIFGKIGDLGWIAGLFYFHEYGSERFNVFGGAVDYNGRIDHKSFAPFAQLNYNVTPNLRVTTGLRYTKDKRAVTTHNLVGGFCVTNPVLVSDAATCEANREKSNDYFSYTLSADYRFSSSLFGYARTSMAHKSGGFNKTTANLESFNPEKVTDYEIGLKADLLGRKLRINAAAFIAYYRNMQRPITSDATGAPVALTQSIGKSRIPGAELEIVAVPVTGLELSGTIGVIDPKYVDFSDATGDRTGEPFTQVSNLTWNIAGTYLIPASYGQYSVHADYGYQSRKYFFPNERSREPGYALLNATIGLTLDNPGIELSLWGRNLTGKKYNSYILDFYNAAGVTTGFPGQARTYGVAATYRF
ncbi:TonB-dependent receptor [Sphingobium sp. CFD-1]|uniref:TonB-dependent receptor n=1 Tax=Sphingobium sp. CFD-1 TaxID=2878545 RepID=UPI00214C54D8|nr:TonB-dependent receptor [Sphingobium sp. CFD-1]